MGARRRLTFALGLAVFLVGGAVLSVAITSRPGRGSAQVTILYAATSIPAGTTGATAVQQGMVRTRSTPAAARPLGALTDVSQLAGKMTTAVIPPGRVLVAEDFPQAPTRLGTVKIPPDKMALGVKLASVPGVAGFAAAGDHIDVFAVTKQAAAASSGGEPAVHLVMQNVEIINVNGGTVAPIQGKPDGPDLVFLLAVTASQAERLIYLTSFEQLYFSLVPSNQAPVTSTPGSGPADALRLS